MQILVCLVFIVMNLPLLLATGSPSEPILRETQFDKDLIPGSAGVGARLPLANARQIVRNRSGSWFVGFDSSTGPRLAVASRSQSEGRHFGETIGLSRLLGRTPASSHGFSMALDPQDRLHAVWGVEEGLYYTWCDVSGAEGYRKVSHREAWKTSTGAEGAERVAGSGARLGDISAGPEGRLWLAFSRQGAIVVGALEKGRGAWKLNRVVDPLSRWAVVTEPDDHSRYEIRQIEEGCRDPVLAVGSEGTVHLAFAHRWEIYYTRSRDGEVWRGVSSDEPKRPDLGYWDSPFPNADRAAFAHSFHPSLVLYREQPLILFQLEGMVDPDPHSPHFMKQRWNGVPSVGYAYLEGQSWRRDYLFKSREIMMKRLPPGEGHGEEGQRMRKVGGLDGAGRVFLADEAQWRPVAGTDRFGVPWAIWNGTTRRYNYFSRFLGEEFAERREWRGAFYGLTKESTVEKNAPPRSSELGTAVVAADRLYFCRMPVGAVDAGQDRHYQVLDLLEFSASNNVQTGLTPYRRHPSSPIFGVNPRREAWDGSLVGGGFVYFAKGLYRMLYSGSGPQNWEVEDGDITNQFIGYAESRDGIHFQRKNLGLREFRGNRDNNLVFSVKSFEDPDETDPEKRFKGFVTGRYFLKQLGKEGRVLFAHSADRVHWTVVEDITEKAPRSDHGAGPSYRDPFDLPERRYKSIHRAYNLTGRAMGMSYSAQLLGPWEGFEDVLNYYEPYTYPPHPTKVRSGWLILEAGGGDDEDQIYGGRGWIEDGIYYLQYTRCYFDGRYDVSLAMSRDGLNFYRIKNGRSQLSPSGAGNWDSGIVAGGTLIDRGEEKWLYYNGAPWHHNTMVRPGGRRALTGEIFGRPEWYTGIATIRNHSWTYAAVGDPTRDGYLDTVPFRIQPTANRKLLLNLDGIGPDGKVLVEVLSASDRRPIEGFSRADCEPVPGALDVPVHWKGGKRLEDIPAEEVILRFYLSGPDTRFHGFRFGM